MEEGPIYFISCRYRKEQEGICHDKDVILTQKYGGASDMLFIDTETNDVMTPRNMKEVKIMKISCDAKIIIKFEIKCKHNKKMTGSKRCRTYVQKKTRYWDLTLCFARLVFHKLFERNLVPPH